jgi:hypothetical protein
MFKHSKKLVFLPFLLIFLPTLTHAETYIVTGTIKASDCWDFGVSVCSTKTVTEVRKDGMRYELPQYFERVSEYNDRTKVCHINTKSKGAGLLSFGVNAAFQPDFWGYDKNGKFGKIDADYIYFSCIKR